MQLPTEIQAQMNNLVANPAFLENIEHYTNAALSTLIDGNVEGDEECPTAYLVMISYWLEKSRSIEQLVSKFPTEVHATLIKCLNKQQVKGYGSNSLEMIMWDENRLCDVSWRMWVEESRQIWQVILKMTNGKQIKMTLKYQELAMLVFKLSQIVGHVSGVNVIGDRN